MKTIKTYESFHFLKKRSKVTLEEVKEAFIELCDKGYNVKVLYLHENTIFVRIKLENYETFIISDIKDTLDVAIPYLKEAFNLKIKKIKYDENDDSSWTYDIYKPIRKLKKLDYQREIRYLKIYFI